MSTTTVTSEKQLTNSPIHLTIGQTSGSFPISIPFPADYIMVLNDTEATIAVCVGERSDQSADAQLWSPGDFISLPLIETTQKLTVFWTSDQPIAVNSNLVQFYFSNVTIPLQGGNYGATATNTNVNVLNSVTTQFANTQPVNVESMPILTSTDGTNTHQLKSDTNGALMVNVVNPGGTASNVVVSSALPAGSNHIGSVTIDQETSLPAGSNNIGHVNIDNAVTIASMPPVTVSSQPIRAAHKYYEGVIGTTEVIFDMSTTTEGNCNQIVFLENDDATNDLWVSFDGVTATAASSNGENGIIHLKAGEVMNDIPRQCTSIHFIRSVSGGNVRFLGV